MIGVPALYQRVITERAFALRPNEQNNSLPACEFSFHIKNELVLTLEYHYCNIAMLR